MSGDDWDIVDLDTVPERNAGRTIDTMHRAAMVARKHPDRRGSVIHLPPKGEVVVTGDMHGCRENFQRIIKFADLGSHPSRHLVLHELEHGGPEDDQGGCRSFELIEETAELIIDFPTQVHMLLANHDVAEMLNIQLAKGSTNLTQKFADGLAHAYGSRAPEVKQAYCDFFKTLPLAIKTPNGVWISHSTPHLDALIDFDYSIFDRELVDDDFTRDSDLYSFLWGRNQSDMAAKIFADHVGCDVLIVGHQPSQMSYRVPNSHHIILYSDNQLGRYLVLPLDRPTNQYVLSHSIQKIADLPR